MTSRSRSRQFAVQMLYQHAFTNDQPELLFERFWVSAKADDETKGFTQSLVLGVIDHETELDLEITAYLKNWTLDRIAKIDHLILRLAIYELLHADDVPWKVVINEAVALAKMFCSEKSATFINGVLHAWCEKNKG